MPPPAAYPRRVLIVTQYFWPEPGAPSVRYEAIVRTLHDMGVAVDVVTGVPNYPTGRIRPPYRAIGFQVEEHDGARVHRLPLFAYGGTNTWLRLLNHASFAASALLAIVPRWKADLVIAESPPLPVAVTGALIAQRLGVPLVVYASDLWPDVPVAMGVLREGRLLDGLRAVERFVYRRAWRITVTSERVLARLAKHEDAGREKLLLLPNGVDPRVFHPIDPAECEEEQHAIGPLSRRALFLYAGTVGHAQALQTILDAAAALRADPGVGFLFLGDGPERPHLEARAAEEHLDNVRFLDAVPPDRVARFIALARATVAPLRDVELFETTRPAKVLPSLACARPVIFCGRGEMATLIEREGCGVVVAPEDGGRLADAVTRLARSPEEASAMGARGRAWALREYDFGGLVRRWWDALVTSLPTARGSS